MRVCAQVDQLVFRHLVEAGFPRLAGHLEALGAGVAGVSTQWFLCLFVNSLPLETCLRVWDIFFFERCSSVLFRVALALVDIYAQVDSFQGIMSAFSQPLGCTIAVSARTKAVIKRRRKVASMVVTNQFMACSAPLE